MTTWNSGRGPDEFKLFVQAPAQMLTTNAERRIHWGARSRIVRAWRECAWACSLGSCRTPSDRPHFDQVMIEAYPQQARGKLADAEAHHPVVKACIDGVVDAKIIDDDDPSHVLGIIEHPPTRGPDSMTLVIRSVPQGTS